MRQISELTAADAVPAGATRDAEASDVRVDGVGQLSGWGRTFVPGRERRSEQLERIAHGVGLSRGMGRSYGDSSLPARGALDTVGTTLADRILSFDPATGLLRVEAGFSLYEMNRIFLPRGWFTPVTPGTQFVTVGGMVASDVHGKNHHVNGCFGQHVQAIKLLVADGRVIECSRAHEPELFCATVGGMGLTGHILEVAFHMERVPSPWIYSVKQRISDIDALLDALKASAAEWPFTVGWIDSLAGSGRGHLYCGRWATAAEAPSEPPAPKRRIPVPFPLPSGMVNAMTVRSFNAAWYWRIGKRPKVGIEHPQSYFYPLDMIDRWNLLYGKRGVTQYQCVIPEEAGRQPVRDLLRLLSAHRTASFLTVVKDCGPEGEGLLSFPKPGVSVALDLPITDGTQATIDALNDVVLRTGGRFYLTKDGFARPEHFRAMEPRLDAFLAVRRKWDPELRIRSAQSQRLMGDS